MDGYGQYPARTTAQLEDFTTAINRELTMTDYQEHEREKAQMYLDYYDETSEAKQAYEWRRLLSRSAKLPSQLPVATATSQLTSTFSTIQSSPIRRSQSPH